MYFKIKIANFVIEIITARVNTRDFCRAFLTDEKPEIHININEDDINYERFKHKGMYNNAVVSDESLEILALLRKVSEIIVDYNAFTIHGAAIAVNNKGLIFTGKSGIGKTTHIFKWGLNIPDMTIVNGDKPFVYVDQVPLLYSSPWAGKEGLYKNISVPLKSIILMERCDVNQIEQISFAEAFPYLYTQIYHSEKKEKVRKTLSLIQSLSDSVSYYKFRCNNFKDDCFEISYKALFGTETNIMI